MENHTLQTQAETIDANLLDAINQIHNTQSNSSITVSKYFRQNTITILLKLGTFNFYSFLEKCHQVHQISELGLAEDEWILNSSPKFYNCIFLKHKIERVSIKIFRNGNLHLTGVQCVTKALDYGEQMCSVIQAFASEQLAIQGFDIQLINGAFKFALPDNRAFCMENMYCLLKQKLTEPTYNASGYHIVVDCLFNSDYHSALKIKFFFKNSNNSSTTTVSIFTTGSILIQSFRNGHQLLFVYDFVHKFVSENFDGITKLDTKGLKRKRDFDYSSYI